MKLYWGTMKRVILISSVCLAVVIGHLPMAHANYYEVSGNGTWTTMGTSTSPVYTDNGAGLWSFSFDVSNPLSSNPSAASNFLFNGYGSNSVTIVNTSGSALVPLGQFTYQGGVAFDPGSISNLYSIGGSSITTWGSNTLSQGMFSMLTCLSACNPNNQTTGGYGPDGFLITGTNVLSGTSLLTGTYNVGINRDAGNSIGSGSLIILAQPGSIPGGGVSATPEPSTLTLFGTGILLMGYMSYRRKKAA